MDGKTAGRLYDFFEETVEAVWESLPAVDVVVTRRPGGWQMTLMLECEAELQTLRHRFPEIEVEQDEEMCYCRLTAAAGGARA